MISRLPPAAAAAEDGSSATTAAAAAGRPIVLVPDIWGGSSRAQQQTQEQGVATAAVAGGVQVNAEGLGLSGVSKAQLQHAQQMGLLVLGQRWLMDSVSSMQLLPVQAYQYPMIQ